MKFRSNRCNHAIDEAELGCIDRESETGYSEDTDQDNVGSTVVDDVEQTDGGGAEVGSRSGESGRGCSRSDAAVVARIGLMAVGRGAPEVGCCDRKRGLCRADPREGCAAVRQLLRPVASCRGAVLLSFPSLSC